MCLALQAVMVWQICWWGLALTPSFFLQLEKLEKFRKRQQPVEAETDEQNEVRKHQERGREEGEGRKNERGREGGWRRKLGQEKGKQEGGRANERGRERGWRKNEGGRERGMREEQRERGMREEQRERESVLRLSISSFSMMILALGLKSACWISTQS